MHGRFGELCCGLQVEPSARSMENKHVTVHVDGDASSFAKLNARTEDSANPSLLHSA